jgi:[ribosomal protein S5]-alanine N-acetyltransferase
MTPSKIVTPQLETDRLYLEPIRRDHAPELYPALLDERLYWFIPQDPPLSPEALGKRFELLEPGISPRNDELWPNWILRLKSEGQCIGRVEATVRKQGDGLIAYEIIPPLWRQGFATEACEHVISVLFDLYGVHTLKAEVDTRNTSSIRLLERLGFRRVEVRYGVDFFKGASSDEFVFSLVRPSNCESLSFNVRE